MDRIRQAALLWLVFSAFLFPAIAADEKVPRPSGWVNDYADVISEEYRRKITSLIDELEEKTSAEIAVITERSIAPYDEQTYARMIFDNWKIGKRGKDNGVLILLAVKERRWRIETGFGVEGILPDSLCGEIGRNYMVPFFKAGRYGEGIYNGVAAIASTIANDAKIKLQRLEGTEISAVGVMNKGLPAKKTPFLLYIILPLFFFFWNLPWPIYIGLPVTIMFAFAFSALSPLMPYLIIEAYIIALMARYNY
ncbi:MAG: TPM domain-containing protein, partial [Candidatus Omnitrophica bacterium]|nr:TPM domain-containing protein [Candidatus Omnitrophota bacterium]